MYISIRGHNSISVFNIQDDKLELIQNIYCEGDNPRDITIDKYGRNLLCANLNSDNISIFSINNGFLKYRKKFIIEKPSCIIVDSGQI